MLEEVDKVINTSFVSDIQARKLLEHFRDALKLHSEENDHLKRMENKSS